MKYTEAQEKGFVEVLKEIQRSIPKALISSALSEQKLSPNVEKVMLEAIETETISKEKREQIQNLINTGMFAKKVVAEDANRVKQLNNMVNRAINKAIKEGRLPPKSHVKYLPSIMKIRNEDKKTSN